MITQLRKFLWKRFSLLHSTYLRKFYGMQIGKNVKIAMSAILDRSINPKGIHIGDNVAIGRDAIILAHDASRKMKSNTFIGNNCFIGIRAIILPGITLGDEVIVGAGSVVTKNFPSNCIIAGNPAKIIRENIHCGPYGKLIQ